MNTRERIARALMGQREQQYQGAVRRAGPRNGPPQDEGRPSDWKFRARPMGGLANLHGLRLTATKRF